MLIINVDKFIFKINSYLFMNDEYGYMEYIKIMSIQVYNI